MTNEEQVLGPGVVPVASLNVRIRNQQGKTYLGNYHHTVELSETGAFIWRRIDGVRTVEALGRLVADEYDVPADEAAGDLTGFLTDLSSYGLLGFREVAG